MSGLQSLPVSVQNRLQQVVSSLIGSMAKVPKAWIDSTAKSITANSEAEFALQKAIVIAAKKRIAQDDELINAAIEAYLPSSIRKSRNRFRVLQSAAQNLKEDVDENKDSTCDEKSVDEDWLNIFARQAEDASSERMQALLGKILSGEIRKPGSFSPSTLRIVSEMDEEMALDIKRFSQIVVGDCVYTDESWLSGEKFNFANRLALHGFISATAGQVSRVVEVNAQGLAIHALGNTFLEIHAPAYQKINAPVLELTKVAMQLRTLFPQPENALELIKDSALKIKNNNQIIAHCKLILPGIFEIVI
ncbi:MULTISPECIES: DUF2806 domain-containing protein [unclassified Novosphingobium]|uniref:DUF2806 domain-containing protein n=1 Tax=unclassified Novosphingobium TaxID=2644732 RepID=UPI0014947805|nr:hypothetical protein [Novosphingobium sp. BK256]MBB3376496.1 hypothetical protein [Novosphingobium sp. BK280]MBB3380909.1 hypothetical protein [Novosphingobium sp. BK258]MBB3422560.1 hypothetical protein [Novosphingobium sp. BK267]MBB3451287.1 hypothetical protein [Novosphingobium sp. BK352]MBB3479767.1 hypothetical protein [Novosphingobium sp. BK369]MBB3503081.1 hypothetical protein [Novosphingobium sp. BK336]MBB3538896.1 hypothetical protein [Novosphingobium sp. BK486]MBB3558264.1 hypo